MNVGDLYCLDMVESHIFSSIYRFLLVEAH